MAINNRILRVLVPSTLTGRVFALYSLTLIVFVGLGLVMFLHYQYDEMVVEKQEAAIMQVEVVAQALQESAVIGDFDSVQKTLERAVLGPTFATATFIEPTGTKISADHHAQGKTYAPQWLVALIQKRMFDVNRTLSVGGRDYGVLRLQFDVAYVAGDLFFVAMMALLLGLASLVGGMVAVRFPLSNWLGSLEQLNALVEALGKGTLDAMKQVPQDAPAEIRRLVDLVNQTAVLVRDREATRRALDDQKFALDQHAIVSMTDRNGVITYANEKFCDISGYRRDELSGSTHQLVNSGVHPKSYFEHMWQTISQGKVWHGEICNRKKAGGLYWVNATIVPLMGADGLPDHYIAIRTDITDRKAIEHSLEDARNAAVQASVAKGQFLANMSHELRTPMNAILGILTLLQSTEMTPQQLSYTVKTEGAARSLLSLLNDILDFSKVEAGKMTLDPRPFRVDRLMRDLSVILSANVAGKGIDVLFDVDPMMPKALVGDDMRLQQILINLGSNAIKFTSEGEVVVHLRVKEQTENDVLIQFAVSDSGIGIAPEHQDHIFSGFSQAEASTTRRFGGTGLGLAICQRLVALMNGQLTLQSTQGQGSTFSFTVRLQIDPIPVVQALRPAVGLRTLVVDDNDLALELMGSMTTTLGWRTDTAQSGQQALNLVEKSLDEGTPYQLVFVDWKMPEMDGWELARRIRQQMGSKCLVLMVSAHGREMLAQRSVAEQATLNGFLVKPVTASMLLDAVMEAQAASATASMGGNPAAPKAVTKPKRLLGMRILVVEDNKINQLVAKGLLSQEGAIVTLADNGQIGVQTLRDRSDAFDVVLMDVQMPVMDGYVATRTIRKELGLVELPVIAMTANAMASDREACLAAGMNDHVGKPFEIDHLVAMLGQYAPPWMAAPT